LHKTPAFAAEEFVCPKFPLRDTEEILTITQPPFFLVLKRLAEPLPYYTSA